MTLRRRVVVTGAAGFLAAATLRRLVATGHDVLAWVRPGSDLWRLEALKSIEVLSLDLRDLLSPSGAAVAERALSRFRPDAVVHAAWQGTRGGSRDDPAQADNVPPAIMLIRLAAASGARRFVGLGSQAEYGPQTGVITEDTPTLPSNTYGASKLACGHLSLALSRALGLSAAWVRLFSVYGPGERSGTLIPDLAVALAGRQPFPLGTCDVRWDYLYEDDAAEALVDFTLQTNAHGFFNLASGNAVPLHDVVLRIEALVGSGTKALFGSRPATISDLPRLEADINRIRGALGWEPSIDLNEGLARTVAAVTGQRRRSVATDG